MASNWNILIVFILLNIYACTSNKCNLNVKIKQTLINEGFHRNITFDITFEELNEGSKWYKNCIIGMEQRYPPGVYVNSDELSDLRRNNKLNVFPQSRVDVELPAGRSSVSIVYLIDKVTNEHMTLWMPVHARYQSARSGGGFAVNEIKGPRLFLHCRDERLRLCALHDQPAPELCGPNESNMCQWAEIAYTRMSEHTLTWRVPVGDMDIYYLVSLGTSLSISLGSMYLLKTIHRYNIQKRKRH